MKFYLPLLLFCAIIFPSLAQLDTVTIAAYNILNYPNATNEPLNVYREGNFRISLTAMNPDILICEEVKEIAGGQRFLDSVLKKINTDYVMGTIINNPINGETENAVFYKSSKFSFINNLPIHTTLRDINEFQMIHTASSVPFSLFAVHLKASNTSTDIDRRRMEIDSLRKVTNLKPLGHNSVVLGDFNIYSANEAAYINVLQDQIINDGEFYDPYVMTGVFNKPEYAAYHTQSPRINNYSDGGAGGGCDDRFDMILNSEAVLASGGMKFITGTCIPYGNDGNHYNDSINSGINTMVSNAIATALVHSSDHLPVLAQYQFSNILFPVEFISIDARANKDKLQINWNVSNEVNLSHYEIEYSYDFKQWNTVGKINADNKNEYNFSAPFHFKAHNYFRIRANDWDNGFYCSSVKDVQDLQKNILSVYPNPAQNIIHIASNSDEIQVIQIIDELGRVRQSFEMEKNYTLDLSEWENGIYFIMNEGKGIAKFLKIGHK